MDAGMDANNGRQILLRVNLIRIATRCSSHGCPAVFRDSQQVPQRRTDALFSRLSRPGEHLAPQRRLGSHTSIGESDHRSLVLRAPPAAHTQSLSAARRSAL